MVSFYLINFWNFISDSNNLLDDGWYIDDLVLDGFQWNHNLLDCGDLFNDFIVIWHDLFNLFDSLLNNSLVSYCHKFNCFNFLESYLNDLFDLLGHLNDLFNLSFYWNEFLYYSVDWYWDLNWNCVRSIDLDYFLDFNDLWNNSVNMNFSWYFNSDLNNFLAFFLDNSNNLNDFLVWDNFFSEFFNNSVYFIVDILNDLNFLDSFLDDRNLN